MILEMADNHLLCQGTLPEIMWARLKQSVAQMLCL